MKILITGSHGLIGSNLARYLHDQTDYEVVCVDDLSCGTMQNSLHGLRCYHSTIGDDVMDEIVRTEKPAIVYHFAAYAAECLSPFIRKYNYQNNLIATAEVVNACIKHNVGRLVFTSSMAVYGAGDTPFRENQPCRPHDPYGVAKLACEQDIQIAGIQHGLDWCILRPNNVYGPGQVVDQEYRNVLALWMKQHLDGKPIRIFGDGSQVRAFTYVEDIMAPLVSAGRSKQTSRQIINLGGSRPIAIREAAGIVGQVIGDVAIEYCEPRHEVHTAHSCSEKANKLLWYFDEVSLAEGVEELWNWVQGYQHHETAGPTLEITDELHPSWEQKWSLSQNAK